MIRINLLPKEKKKAAIEINRGLVFGTLGVIVLAVLLFGVTQYQNMKLSDLDDSVTSANEELTRLKPIINAVEQVTKLRTVILTRKTAIEKLDNERGMEVHLIQDLSERLPDYLWLTASTQNTDAQGSLTMDLTGYSFSIKHIETFLVKLYKSPMYSSVNLATIVQDVNDGQKVYRFTINTVIRSDWLSAKEKGDIEATSAAKVGAPEQAITPQGSGLVGKGREALKMNPEEGKKAMEGMR